MEEGGLWRHICNCIWGMASGRRRDRGQCIKSENKDWSRAFSSLIDVIWVSNTRRNCPVFAPARPSLANGIENELYCNLHTQSQHWPCIESYMHQKRVNIIVTLWAGILHCPAYGRSMSVLWKALEVRCTKDSDILFGIHVCIPLLQRVWKVRVIAVFIWYWYYGTK